MKDRTSEISINNIMVCAGNSMYPTLRILDTLSILPYTGRQIRRGDVVIFIAPDSRRVTHRVVQITREGITTHGDNNLEQDDWTLSHEVILGQVIEVRRGNRKIKIHGGYAGYIVGTKARLVCQVKCGVLRLLKPLYDFGSRSGIFRIWLPAGLKPKVLYFNRQGKTEIQLQMGKKSIGSYDPEMKCWRILPPYRLFVDDADLRGERRLEVGKRSE